jgi:hypothetical protein
VSPASQQTGVAPALGPHPTTLRSDVSFYIRSQLGGWEALLANTSDALNHGDSLGPWLQGFLEVTNSGVTGGSAPCSSSFGLCVNPYPKPGDSTNPHPYVKGQYPKLLPYFPKAAKP